MRYVYYCPVCDAETEVDHKMFEAPEVRCADCGSTMEKKICCTTYILKGFGWCGKNKHNVQFVEKKK